MPVKIYKKVSLAHLGENHKDDQIIFSELSFKDARELQDIGTDSGQKDALERVFQVLKDKFISGQLTDEDTHETTRLTPDDLEELPVSVITHCIKMLSGGTDENL